MPLALILAVALLQNAEPAAVELDGRLRRIVGFRGMGLTVETGGAIDVGVVAAMDDHRAKLSASPFWRGLVEGSVPSKARFGGTVPRVVVDLDDGRRIVVDRDARFVVVPQTLPTLWDWRGPVRELTGPQAVDLVRWTRLAFPR